jgi:uncharacterized protein
MGPGTPLLFCTALFFLQPLSGEEPAVQIRHVNQLSVEELSAVRARAIKGDPDAQLTLGLAYDGGNRAFQRDPVEARRWYERSAKQGNLDAQFWLLGLDYSDGKAVRSRYLELSKVCGRRGRAPKFRRGDAMVEDRCGSGFGRGCAQCCNHVPGGRSVAVNDEEAVRWLRRAADQGSTQAAARLGPMAVMKKAGLSPGVDCTRWLQIAADAGDAPSMSNLGMVLFHGTGTQPDLLEAYKWFTLASERGMIDGRTPLRAKMTKIQIAEAEGRASEWNAAHRR